MTSHLKKNKEVIWCNTIALYDLTLTSSSIKACFTLLENWAEEIQIPWESIGLPQASKLILFKNGKRRLEKNEFDFSQFKKKEQFDNSSIELYGGVSEAGTHLDWRIYGSIDMSDRGEMILSFLNHILPFKEEDLSPLIKKLLEASNPSYGIVYQREYTKGPDLYAAGCISGLNYTPEELIERKQISAWFYKYSSPDAIYRTGLLRDVYPFNVFIDTHLTQPIGKGTLESWINADPAHGRLEKITDKHWLWAIDPPHIPAAQEALQEAGLLLCYKV